MKITTSLHPKKLTAKPKSFAAFSLGYKTKELTLQELAQYIKQGHSVVPAVMQEKSLVAKKLGQLGHKDGKNFISSQMIFLDYDDNQNPQDIIEQIEEYGFKINIFYNSFSHKPDYNKFRLVIALDTHIDNPDLYEAILKTFIYETGADSKCKDRCRMFLAGTNVKILTEEINSYKEVSGAFMDLINVNKRPNHHKKTRDKVLSICKTDPYKEDCTNMQHPINNIGYCTNGHSSIKKSSIQNFNYEEACKNSKVFDGFDKGHIELKYQALAVLVSNMQFVRGGIKYVGEKMDLRGTYKQVDYNCVSSIPKYNYENPEGMYNFDQNALKEGFYNILHLDKTTRESVTQIREIKKEDVKAIYDRMEMHHTNALNSINRISVINAPTGTGKTKLMISLPNVLIGCPTNDLKNEMAERMEAEGLPYVTTPDNIQFVTKGLQDRYDNLQSMQESSLASNLLKDVEEGREIEGTEYTDEDTMIVIEYKSKLAEAYTSEVTVLTTHKRLMLTPHKFQNKRVTYFDEDITDLLLDVNETPNTYVNDKLESLIRGAKKGSDFERDCRTVLKNVQEITQHRVGILRDSIQWIDRSGFFERLSMLEGCSTLANLIKSTDSLLLSNGKSVSKYYYGQVKRVSSIFEKVVIFSATADRFFYDVLMEKANEKYDFFHCGFAKNLSPIKHNLSKSYSRSAMEDGQFPVTDTKTVITYKDYAQKMPDVEKQELYFGNTEGNDTLKGQDTSIVGVMLAPKNTTLMKAVLLGLGYESTIKSMTRVTLTYFSFSFFTFEDENLANIELRSAMQTLKQANRSRTTRTDAKVDIYTSLPMEDSDIFTGRSFNKSIDESLEPLSTPFVAKSELYNDWELIKQSELRQPPEDDEQTKINFAS